MITEREKKTLTEIGAQLAETFRARGIAEPTPEQITEAFIAQCKRNIELCEIVVYGYSVETGRDYRQEATEITSALAADTYNTIRGKQ